MLSIGKEIGMLMLDMYYDLGDMECDTDMSNSAENKKICINCLQLKPKQYIKDITRSNKINEWQLINDQPHDPQQVSWKSGFCWDDKPRFLESRVLIMYSCISVHKHA